MPQEIYNEGRVVGLSAWEIFVKNVLANGADPNSIPTETQWLTSMIGIGASMVLRIPANTTKGVHDFALPVDSTLSSAGIVIANPFIGSCEFDTSGWATKVTSYGSLIENTSEVHPGTNVPFNDTFHNAEFANCVSEFTKITDGIVFTQNAKWIPTEDGSPYSDIDPNFNESSTTVRLYISSDIGTSPVYVLLTGFTNKRILQGLSGFAAESDGYSVGGSTDVNNNDWKNGGMLGPEMIPWASKIIFTVPSYAYNLVNSLNRTIPSDAEYTSDTYYGFEIKGSGDNTEAKANTFVDFNALNLQDYYTVNAESFTGVPTLQEDIISVATGISDKYNTITAWYPGLTASAINEVTSSVSFFPPALYATQISDSGTQTLIPLDVAAPGTVKGFNNTAQASQYKQMLPDNYAIYANPTTNTFSFVTSTNPSDWSGTTKINYIDNTAKVEVLAGEESVKLVALTNSNHEDYDLSGSAEAVYTGAQPITWAQLLNCLYTGRSLDVMGTNLRALAQEFNGGGNTMGNNSPGVINDFVTAKLTLRSTDSTSMGMRTWMTTTRSNNSPIIAASTGCGYKSGTQFIEFADGKRLYISGTNPGVANVPVGSIGIGW